MVWKHHIFCLKSHRLCLLSAPGGILSEEAFINLIYFANVWHFNKGKLTVDIVRRCRTWKQTAGSRLSGGSRQVPFCFVFFFTSEERGIWSEPGFSSHLHPIWISCLHNSLVNGELLGTATAVLPFLPGKNDVHAVGGGREARPKCLKRKKKNLQVMWCKNTVQTMCDPPEDGRRGTEPNINPPHPSIPPLPHLHTHKH